MIESQIKKRGIEDERVLRAMHKVERHLLLPAELAHAAYQDFPLPIGYDQTISQPYIVAYMTEVLHLDSQDRVLEIGTGSGYQTAILAEIVKEVYSLEIIPELAEQAKNRLRNMGYQNISIQVGDGYQGWPGHAPYDAILVTAAPEFIPPQLIEQLKKPGGQIILPLGSIHQKLLLMTQTSQGLETRSLIPVRFVPMISPIK